MGIAERVFHFLQFRRAAQLHGVIAALDREGELFTGVNADDALHIGEASDRGAVDGRYDVADLKADSRCSAPRLHFVDARRGARLAKEREQSGEDHDRQKEIGDRTGGHDGSARSNPLVVETARALFLGHVGERFGRRGRGLAFVAEELDIATERDRRNLPARTVTVVETGEFGTKTERESQNLYAGPAGNQEVTKFMEENDDGQNKQKRNDIADKAMAQRIETM